MRPSSWSRKPDHRSKKVNLARIKESTKRGHATEGAVGRGRRDQSKKQEMKVLQWQAGILRAQLMFRQGDKLQKMNLWKLLKEYLLRPSKGEQPNKLNHH